VPSALPPPPPPPPLPAPGGDLSGTIVNARIDKLQGAQLLAPGPLVNGHVLTVQGGQWVPSALPPPPPAPTAAPIPPLGGDVQGPPGTNQIVLLQNQRVRASSPGEGDVLRFKGGEWVPELLDIDPAGLQFVGRAKDPFHILGAADVTAELKPTGGPSTTVLSSYNGLVPAAPPSLGPNFIDVLMRLALADPPPLRDFIVKLTPVLMDKTPFPFRVYLLESVTLESSKNVLFRVRILGDQAVKQDGSSFRFQCELSHF
jgi:hypothetical protein